MFAANFAHFHSIERTFVLKARTNLVAHTTRVAEPTLLFELAHLPECACLEFDSLKGPYLRLADRKQHPEPSHKTWPTW